MPFQRDSDCELAGLRAGRAFAFRQKPQRGVASLMKRRSPADIWILASFAGNSSAPALDVEPALRRQYQSGIACPPRPSGCPQALELKAGRQKNSMTSFNPGKWAGLLLTAVWLLDGCSDPHRNFGPAGGDADRSVNPALPAFTGASPTGGEGPPGAIPLVESNGASDPATEPGALGAPCNSPADCDAPGFCVDGVCCESACTELCAACNLPGSVGACSAAPSDGACPPVTCAGESTDCRHLDASQLALTCESFGKCRTTGECVSVNEVAGSTCSQGAGSCDGNGACTVAGKQSLGATCTGDADCAEGHCVQGAGGARICCDTACDGVCQACSASGHCDAPPPADARCPAVTCPADNLCLDYPQSLDAGGCRSFGQCRTSQDCVGSALLPAAQCACGADGSCTLRAGADCTQAGQCQSGACLATVAGDRLCCASGCAAGLFCSSDGARCVACEGNNVDCNGNSESRCNGGAPVATTCPNGCTPGTGCNALPPIGFACPGGQCAGTAVCQSDVNGAARCCARNCAAEGKVCAADGSCACSAGQVAAGTACLLQAGEPCTTNTQCQNGLTCTDGVCCQEACNGTCERCEGGTGTCVAVAQGQQDNQCSGARQCNGQRGDCRSRLRQPCTSDAANAECTTGNCEPVVGNTSSICCAQDCTGARPFCKSDGSSCVQCETNADCGNGCNITSGQCNPLLDIGKDCGSSAQCGSGALCLLDQNGRTRCCERNCAANGQVCNGSGRCVVPTVGAGQPCAVGTVNCSSPLQCINSSCQLPTVGQGQACGAAAVCNGSLGLQCSNGTCNCSSTQRFAQGRCRLADGQDCSQAADCASGECTEWLVDVDGDGFGSLESVGGFPALLKCGPATDANRPPDARGACFGSEVPLRYQPRTPGREDCCDSLGVQCGQQGVAVQSNEAFPGRATLPSSTRAADCGTQNGITFKETNDLDCNGSVDPVATQEGTNAPVPCVPGMRCAERFNAQSCSGALDAVECARRNATIAGTPGCGSFIQQGCVFQNGACVQPGSGPVTVLCR